MAGWLGPALGSVFLIPSPWLGVLLWLGLAFVPLHAGFALVGVAVAAGVERALKVEQSLTLGGGLRANALLAAVAASWLTAKVEIALTAKLAVAVVAAGAAAIITAALIRALARSAMPALVFAYCIVAGLMFELFPAWTWQAVVSTPGWPVPVGILDWVGVFLRSMGTLLFAPDPVVGLVVGTAILVWSRAAFVCGTIGWIAGTVTALGLVQVGTPYLWMPPSYNFFIAGMGLGAVFFMPARSGLPVAAAAGVLASVLVAALQYLLPGSSLPYLPVAASLTIWVGLYALTMSGARERFARRYSLRLQPESDWWEKALASRRFGIREPLVVLPVAGKVTVAQGFNGEFSHLGPLRHALDFQRSAPVHADTSLFEAPVFAPAAGVVERVCNNVVDNPLGVSNYADNWGNYVVIRLDQYARLILAHFRCGSITVEPGMRLEIGSHIGLVGNSGRSPVPHLHMQVQRGADLGEPTCRFRLANYLSYSDTGAGAVRWHASGVPREQDCVSGAPPDPGVHALLAGIAPGTGVWSIESSGPVPIGFRAAPGAASEQMTIAIDALGCHELQTAPGSRLRVRLDPDAWRILSLAGRATPLLRLIALAAPSVPYALTVGMHWQDFVALPGSRLPLWLARSLAPYESSPFVVVESDCTESAGVGHDVLSFTTRIVSENADEWPAILHCRFESVRGPSWVSAIFANGARIECSLVSYSPGS